MQHPRNSSFWEVFGSLLSQYDPTLPVVLQKTKTLFEKFLKDFSIYGRETDPKSKKIKIKKNKKQCEKTSVIELSKYSKMKSLSPLPFSPKIRLIFAIFAIFLPGNRAESQVKGRESKFDKYSFIHTIPGQLPIKKIGSSIFQFCSYRSQTIFQK